MPRSISGFAGPGGSPAYDAWRSRSFGVGVDVDVAAFLAVGDDLVGPAQEVGDFPGWGLEARLAVGRGQLDGQHAAGLAARGSRRRPHLHVAGALAALDAPRQQVAGEDPLDGLFQPGVERDPGGAGVLTGAGKAARQRDDRLRVVTSRSPTSADTVLLLFITRPILIRWVTMPLPACICEPRAWLDE